RRLRERPPPPRHALALPLAADEHGDELLLRDRETLAQRERIRAARVGRERIGVDAVGDRDRARRVRREELADLLGDALRDTDEAPRPIAAKADLLGELAE